MKNRKTEKRKDQKISDKDQRKFLLSLSLDVNPALCEHDSESW